MENTDNDSDSKQTSTSTSTWGRWVFVLTLLATLIFFWWLLLYSHGVTHEV